MKKLTEEDLHRLGLMVVENQVVPMTAPPGETADDDAWWGYGLAHIRYSTELAVQAVVLSRKSALHLFRAGHAFSVLRKRYKEDGTWMRCLEERNLAHSTVLQAIQLYERAGSEQAIEGLTITEGKEKFEILKPKASPTLGSSSEQTSRRRPIARHRPGSNGDGASSSDTNAEADDNLDPQEGQPGIGDHQEGGQESADESEEELDQDIDNQDPYMVLHQIGMVLDRLAERIKRESGEAKNYLEAVDQIEARLKALREAINGIQ